MNTDISFVYIDCTLSDKQLPTFDAANLDKSQDQIVHIIIDIQNQFIAVVNNNLDKCILRP